MSIEIVLYPKTVTKRELKKFLEVEGFKGTDFFLSPSTNINLHFHWFEEKDFKSFDGVEATIYKIEKKDKEKYKCGNWGLHTRTRVSARITIYLNRTILLIKLKKIFQVYFTMIILVGINIHLYLKE